MLFQTPAQESSPKTADLPLPALQEQLEFLNDEHVELSTAWLTTKKNYSMKRKGIKKQARLCVVYRFV